MLVPSKDILVAASKVGMDLTRQERILGDIRPS